MLKKINEFNLAHTLDVYDKKRSRVNKRYGDSDVEHGEVSEIDYKHAAGAYWEEGYESQIARFRNLLNIGVKNGDTVLDFGCAYGSLYKYMKRNGLDRVNYIGVDINKNFIEDARRYYLKKTHTTFNSFLNKQTMPEFPKFYVIRTIDDVKENFDWFLASGVFTYSFEVDEVIEILLKAFNKCNKGIAFNILPAGWSKNITSKSKLGKNYMVHYNPNLLLYELKKYFKNVEYEQIPLNSGYDGVFFIRKFGGISEGKIHPKLNMRYNNFLRKKSKPIKSEYAELDPYGEEEWGSINDKFCDLIDRNKFITVNKNPEKSIKILSTGEKKFIGAKSPHIKEIYMHINGFKYYKIAEIENTKAKFYHSLIFLDNMAEFDTRMETFLISKKSSIEEIEMIKNVFMSLSEDNTFFRDKPLKEILLQNMTFLEKLRFNKSTWI